MAVLPSTKIDCEYDALAAYPGNIQDKELAWLQNNGATSNALPDAWLEFLALQGFTTGDRADDERAYYLSVISGGDVATYGDTLMDLRRTFWCGGYNPP